jgi:hypothetical protein
MAKMKAYNKYMGNGGSMISEDMSAPGNLPRNVVQKSYESMSGAMYDYEGNSVAMYRQEKDDMSTMGRIKAKRRY